MKLTIAIPTYNRPSIIFETISKLISFPNSNDIEILVVDNGSDIDIVQYLKNKLRLVPNLSIKRFETNQGFHESFYRLFEACETEYLMVLSDEDYFDLNFLNDVLKILTSKSPSLLAVSAKKNSRVLVRPNKERIPLYRLQGRSSSISGLIFKVEPVLKKVNFFRALSESEEFAFLYPSVLVAFALALDGQCFDLKVGGIRNGAVAPSTITSRSGEAYYLPTERVYQHASIIRCLNRLTLEYPQHARRIRVIQLSASFNFFGKVYDSVGIISPEVQRDLIMSSLKTAMIFYCRKLFGR